MPSSSSGFSEGEDTSSVVEGDASFVVGGASASASISNSTLFSSLSEEELAEFDKASGIDSYKKQLKKEITDGAKKLDSNDPKLKKDVQRLLTDDAYAALRQKDSNLYDMAWTIGKVDFTVDPESKKITYSDNYGFKGANFHKDYPILGDSEGPTYEFTNPKK